MSQMSFFNVRVSFLDFDDRNKLDHVRLDHLIQ